jgi:hypothetical protein
VADRFHLFRLSLTPRERDLFTPDPPEREEYLRDLLSQEQRFEHWNNPFVYVPAEAPFPFILGQIGRPIIREENLPPDQGFALAQREAWRAAVIAIDPRAHSDGQKVSFSRDEVVGDPFAVLRSFIKHLNEVVSSAPYHIEVEPIFNTASFWTFAEQHKGEVTRVKFEFVTPNMFGSSDELSEELRAFRKEERAQKVAVQVQSSDGLNTDTPKIRESVEYAGKGAGKVIAFTKRGARYNSKDQAETVTVPDDGGEPLLRRAVRLITHILGIQ